MAFLDLGPRQTDEGRATHLRALQSHLDIPKADAEEMLILGRFSSMNATAPCPR